MLENKGTLTIESIETLMPLYNNFIKDAILMEHGLEDLMILANMV